MYLHYTCISNCSFASNEKTYLRMPPVTRRTTRSPSPRFKSHDYGLCPSEPIAQDKYFYGSDGIRQPIYNPGQIIGEYPPKRVRALRFDPQKWRNAPRPANYLGVWPPTSASQLMNTQSVLDTVSEKKVKQLLRTYGEPVIHDCLGKFCWQEAGLPGGVFCMEDYCDHSFSEWLTGAEGWEERFELRDIPNMGCGLHSKQEWEKDDILGAYLGELIPQHNYNTEYCHEVFVGPESSKTSATIAYIDAEKCGNYTRFCNHSCEHNAVISEGRVGKERVLALRAIKYIAAGEQITIDYGTEYFQTRQCLCGSAKCKYPNVVNPVAATASKPGRPRAKKACQLEKNRTIRYDSVLEMEAEMEID